MAYVTSNPPYVMVPRMGTAAAVWIYKSADAHATVDGAGYFTNGSDLGMVVGDVVIVVDTATPACTVHPVSAVTAGGAATIGAGTFS